MGYVQNAGGGWSGDVEVIDSIDLTNAQHAEEVHVKRVNANEISILKHKDGSFTFPVREEEWEQPLDTKIMSRRIKKGKGCSSG